MTPARHASTHGSKHLFLVFALCMTLLGLGLGLTTQALAQTTIPFSPVWGKFVQAADHSYLNRPIAPADSIAVVGPHFFKVGADLKPGTPDDERVRLFGVNLTFDAVFPAPERASETAVTLRSLGFNAVRLHHMDTLPTSDVRQFRSSLTTGPYPTLHAGAVERLRLFIAELRKQGIYVNLNLMVGYAFRPDIDGVPPLDNAGTAPGYSSPAHVFFPKMVALQKLYAQRLLGALQLKNDPVLAQVEIINESSLAGSWLHWNRHHWTEHIKGPYLVELDKQWLTWVTKRYGAIDKACLAWHTCGAETGRMLTPVQAEEIQHGLQSGLLLKLKQKSSAWFQAAKTQLGQAATETATLDKGHPKVLDTLRFIAETDQHFVEEMRQVVHEATRTTLPVAGTQVNFGAPLNFDSHKAMDYVDAHFYVDHPDFPGNAWSDTNWRIRNTYASEAGLGDLLALSLYRDKHRPFVVSEFNQPYPNKLGQEILPITATVAALQDWDGLYFFDYADGKPDRMSPNNFNLQGDWPKTAMVGLAARIFRTPSIRPLEGLTHVVSPAANWYTTTALDRRPDAWERYLGSQLKLGSKLALSRQIANSDTTEPGNKPQLTTGPLQHLKEDRLLIVSAPVVSAVFGELGTGALARTSDLAWVGTPGDPTESVSMLLHTLDGVPIASSKHLLLSIPTRIMGSVPGKQPAQPQQTVPYNGDRSWWTLEVSSSQPGQPSGSRQATLPLWMERKPVVIRFRSNQSALTVYPLGATGSRGTELSPQSVVRTTDGFELKLNATSAQTALWFEITSP